jgi:hypothetical protein
MGKYDNVKLDRDRSYGDTHPPVKAPDALELDQVAHHCQDGLYFDQNGDLCEWMLQNSDIKKLDERKAADEAKEIAQKAFDEAMEKLGYEPGTIAITEIPRKQAAAGASASGEIDLEGYLAGTVKVPFSKFRDAFKKKYGYAPANKAAAEKFLAEKGTGFGGGGDEVAKAEANAA